MSSRHLLLLGNIAAIIVTIAAFLQALSWPIAGVLILVSLVFPLLANISPPRGSMTSDPASKIPVTTRRSQIETKTSQHRPPEKHTTPNYQSSTKIDQRPSPKPECTPPSKGKVFFVVENADDRAVSVTVKIQKGTASPVPA